MRYQGFPEFVNVLVDIGFLSDEPKSFLNDPITWREATQQMLGASASSEEELLKVISAKPSVQSHPNKDRLISGLKWRKFSSIIERG